MVFELPQPLPIIVILDRFDCVSFNLTKEANLTSLVKSYPFKKLVSSLLLVSIKTKTKQKNLN